MTVTRKNLGISLEDVAEKLGWSPDYLVHFEHHLDNQSLHLVRQYFAAMNCDIFALSNGQNYREQI